MADVDETRVIQGDEQSHDGHYRAKDTLRVQDSESRSNVDRSGDELSLSAQNPVELPGTRIGRAFQDAAGIPAVLNSARYGLREIGVSHTVRSWQQINQKDGFDCQSCAWPSPDQKRKFFEFCENGAKAAADEGTKKRIRPEFFAQHSIEQLAAQSDYWLNQQGRLTEPMVRRAGATYYTPIDWPDAFKLLGETLKELASPNEAAFYTSGKTTNEPAFLLQLFARQFGTNNLPDCSNRHCQLGGRIPI